MAWQTIVHQYLWTSDLSLTTSSPVKAAMMRSTCGDLNPPSFPAKLPSIFGPARLLPERSAGMPGSVGIGIHPALGIRYWYPGPGRAGKPETSHYFERFPDTGQVWRRAHTALPSRTHKMASPVTPEPLLRQLHITSTTKTTDCGDDVNIISVEPSEDGGGSNEKGVSYQTRNAGGRLLKSRQSDAGGQKRVAEETSSSSYTTYTRLPSPPSSHTHQP
ncbi:hypothetical protein ACOMHN_007205 [Nucella lapillus]